MKMAVKLLATCVLPMVFAACSSIPRAQSVDPALALHQPYKLRLSLNQEEANSSDIVIAYIEFENTGKEVLWVPKRSDLEFGFEYGSSMIESSQSFGHGRGLQFVPVRPGKTLKYEKGFIVPQMYGSLHVYITANREITAPLSVGSN